MDTNIVTIKKDAESFLAVGNSLLLKVESLQIKSQADVDMATVILKDCQKTEKELEEKRVSIMKPIRSFVDEVNTLFKETASPLLQAKDKVKVKIIEYNAELQRKKLEEQRKAQEAEKARQAQIEKERKEREDAEIKKRLEEEKALKEKQQSDPAFVEAEKKRIETERQKRLEEESKKRTEEEARQAIEKRLAEEKAAAAENERVKGITKRVVYEVIEPTLVPRHFCSPDSKKINEAIKSGVRTIEGLRIYEVESVK